MRKTIASDRNKKKAFLHLGLKEVNDKVLKPARGPRERELVLIEF